MGKITIYITIGIIAATGITAMNAEFVSAASYRVTKVVDGDTISVRMGKNDVLVRLIGVDAPELSSRSNTKKGCFAAQAKDYLSRKLLGKNVTLNGDYLSGDKDYYGRLLRYVYLNGEDISRTLVLNGYARQYKYWNNDYMNRYSYTLLESVARATWRGLWNPWTCPVNR